jgi:hypothetical protein
VLAGAELKSTRYHPGFFFTENFFWAVLLQNLTSTTTTQFFSFPLEKNGRAKENQDAWRIREYVFVFAIASLHPQFAL